MDENTIPQNAAEAAPVNPVPPEEEFGEDVVVRSAAKVPPPVTEDVCFSQVIKGEPIPQWQPEPPAVPTPETQPVPPLDPVASQPVPPQEEATEAPPQAVPQVSPQEPLTEEDVGVAIAAGGSVPTAEEVERIVKEQDELLGRQTKVSIKELDFLEKIRGVPLIYDLFVNGDVEVGNGMFPSSKDDEVMEKLQESLIKERNGMPLGPDEDAAAILAQLRDECRERYRKTMKSADELERDMDQIGAVMTLNKLLRKLEKRKSIVKKGEEALSEMGPLIQACRALVSTYPQEMGGIARATPVLLDDFEEWTRFRIEGRRLSLRRVEMLEHQSLNRGVQQEDPNLGKPAPSPSWEDTGEKF